MTDPTQQAVDILRGAALSTLEFLAKENFDPLILARAAKQSAALAERVLLEQRTKRNAKLMETAGVA